MSDMCARRWATRPALNVLQALSCLLLAAAGRHAHTGPDRFVVLALLVLALANLVMAARIREDPAGSTRAE